MAIKLSPAPSQTNAVALIRSNWISFFPDAPFDFFFLEDFYSSQYAGDLQVIHVFDVFCGLAVLIACLGLFGLSIFTTRQRIKELGIRKVLGAGFNDLSGLLLREFLRPVALACAVAAPFLIFALQNWLDHFAFHTDLNAVEFALPILMVMGIATLTVGFQTAKAASGNPIESLRHE